MRLGCVLALCAVVASSCGATGHEPAALTTDGAQVLLCLPAPSHEVVTDAEDDLKDVRLKEVTLRAVSLVDAHGLRMVGPALLPASDGTPGIGGSYPPVRGWASLPAAVWSTRTSVDQKLPAGVADANVIFGVALSPGYSTGTATGTRVEYEQDHAVRVVTIPTRLTLVDTDRCDSVIHPTRTPTGR